MSGNFIDKSLLFFDKPISKLTNKPIKLYHGSYAYIKGDVIKPESINVGATSFSSPRWSTFFWDAYERAVRWNIANEYWDLEINTIFLDPKDKITVLENDFDIEKIAKENRTLYVYECVVDSNDVEIGSCPVIKEYTVSKDVRIVKKHKFKLTKALMREHTNIVSKETFIKMMNTKSYNKKVRTPILNMILDRKRDESRFIIMKDLQSGELKPGESDLSKYRMDINKEILRRVRNNE